MWKYINCKIFFLFWEINYLGKKDQICVRKRALGGCWALWHKSLSLKGMWDHRLLTKEDKQVKKGFAFAFEYLGYWGAHNPTLWAPLLWSLSIGVVVVSQQFKTLLFNCDKYLHLIPHVHAWLIHWTRLKAYSPLLSFIILRVLIPKGCLLFRYCKWYIL